jgi:hypothetical protein
MSALLLTHILQHKKNNCFEFIDSEVAVLVSLIGFHPSLNKNSLMPILSFTIYINYFMQGTGTVISMISALRIS